jgi:hypothetical protein
VLYLGSFLANGTLEMGKLGFIPMPFPSTVYFSYADKWDRDQKVFTSGSEFAVDPSLVEHTVLSVNQCADYYIMAEDHVPLPKVKLHDISSGSASFAGRIAAYKAAHPEDASSTAPTAGASAPSTPPPLAAPAAPLVMTTPAAPAAPESTAPAATPAGS